MTLKPRKQYDFLVDVNLPQRFKFFNLPNFKHIAEINPKMTDEELWDYALKNDCIIITKDADFYDRFSNSDNCPKIIYLQIGNFTLKDLHSYFEQNWETILKHLDNASIIIASLKQIRVIK